jgi:hypothetical protein
MYLLARTRFQRLAPVMLMVFTLNCFATTRYNVDQIDWNSCTVCAGAGGQGSAATHWFKRGVSSPSRDGAATHFFLGGSDPYSNAYWWSPLATNSTATNFTYDLYFYMKNPGAAQALEFEVNQGLDGKKYIFGVQCGFKSHAWRVYDAYNHKWVATSKTCTVPTAYKWHHAVFEFHRTSAGKSQFISITINGEKSYVNRYYSPKSSSLKTVNVAFQMDGNSSQTDYSVWLDSMKVSWW